MPSFKLLSGLAHDLGEHAQSALSGLHPHLGEACRSASIHGTELDLVEGAPHPRDLPVSEPLRMGISSIRQRFSAMLAARGFSAADIRSAVLICRFTGGGGDHVAAVRVAIVASDGRTYSRDLGFVA
jgi:hypothetical protein